MPYKMISEKMIFKISGNPQKVWKRIWQIGGNNGWYYGTKLWKIRGFLDKLAGGIGYRKGRRDPNNIQVGDPIDFWRVVKADPTSQTLRLKAEMKLPGEVFLQWEIKQNQLLQTMEFFPSSIVGKIYWFLVRPLHYWIFYQMGKKITLQQCRKSPH
jgi:hypothetical protein